MPAMPPSPILAKTKKFKAINPKPTAVRESASMPSTTSTLTLISSGLDSFLPRRISSSEYPNALSRSTSSSAICNKTRHLLVLLAAADCVSPRGTGGERRPWTFTAAKTRTRVKGTQVLEIMLVNRASTIPVLSMHHFLKAVAAHCKIVGTVVFEVERSSFYLIGLVNFESASQNGQIYPSRRRTQKK